LSKFTGAISVSVLIITDIDSKNHPLLAVFLPGLEVRGKADGVLKFLYA